MRTADPTLRLALGTGFLGGPTTFNTASVDPVRPFRGGEGWRLIARADGMFVLSEASAGLGFGLGSL